MSTDNLKPLFTSIKDIDNPPYYDPNDLHVHIWKTGKLGVIESPKVQKYSDGKIIIRDCTYCKICHTIKDNFQSTVGKDKDVVKDIFTIVDNNKKVDNYIVTNTSNTDDYNVRKIDRTVHNNKKVEINNKLFHKNKSITNNYVKIV